MAQSVTAAFTAAEKADINQPTSTVQLVLGNYANGPAFGATAISSDSDASGNFPASGAIDGDRTEINIGSASAADNGVGKSSWRSASVPQSGNVPWLEIDFNAVRTFNRIKLYHLDDHGLKSYAIEYWSIALQTWVAFIGTSDMSSGGSWGYGMPPYGDTAYGGSGDTITPTFVTTNLELDVIDTPDVTTTKLRIYIGDTEAAGDTANIVEFEVYRKIDISSRITGWRVERKRDFTLTYNIASSATISIDNSDRFFSFNHVPTSSESSSGFVNSEIQPQIGIIIKEGFAYGGGNSELIPKFTGYLDTITLRPSDQSGTLEARDGIKNLINFVDTSNLKTSVDIGTAIAYALNRANVSNYEMNIDQTTITEDYFFYYQTAVYSVIGDLVRASGDASFYYDESGTAQFKMWLNSVPKSHVDTVTADWVAGTATNCDAAATPNQMYLLRPWYQYTNYASWNAVSNTSVTVATSSSQISLTPTANNENAEYDAASTQAYGSWRWQVNHQTDANLKSFFQFIKTSAGAAQAGYSIMFTGGNLYFLIGNPLDATVQSSGIARGTVGTFLGSSIHEVRISRSTDGSFSFYVDGVLYQQLIDTTYLSCVKISFLQTTSAGSLTPLVLSNLYYNSGSEYFLYSTSTSTPSTATADFISEVIDQSASVNQEGTLAASTSILGTDPVLWYSRTSADNISYDSDVAATLGSGIGSAVHRYMKYHITYSPTVLDNTYVTPIIYDVTATWFTGSGSKKYHATADYSLRYDGVMLGLEEELSDNLGGDTAIINDIYVTAAPLALTGTVNDTQWQGTTGTPAAAISGSNTLAVSVGTYTYNVQISAGMDTSLMSGANPAAAVVTFASSAAGSWVYSYINPTQPILVITITHAGTIIDLRAVGKAFSSATTPYQAYSTNAASISKYQRRTQTIQNDYIISQAIAQNIGDRIVLNQANPISYLKSLKITPTPSMQIGDRLTLVDYNTDTNGDYNAIAISDTFQVTPSGATIDTDIVPVKIS